MDGEVVFGYLAILKKNFTSAKKSFQILLRHFHRGINF